ncbi:MAG: hypothetical protein ACI84O_001647 [Myxococcota bacterium]|jgi:hypothetical protein
MILSLAAFSCASQPLQITADEAANYESVQIMTSHNRPDLVLKYFGIVRQELNHDVDVAAAQEIMQLQAYRKGCNAIIRFRRSKEYLEGELVLLDS